MLSYDEKMLQSIFCEKSEDVVTMALGFYTKIGR